MANESTLNFPKVGDPAPVFEIMTPKGALQFPTFSEGSWCIFFAHPANFTSAWAMYSSFLTMKERWFNQRNTKLLALSSEPLKQNKHWQDLMRRYIGIFLKAAVIEDLDLTISNLYGMASGRKNQAGFDRIIFVIDPNGIIRLIVRRPLLNIENAMLDLMRELDRLQGNYEKGEQETILNPVELKDMTETPDSIPKSRKLRPAYFRRKDLNMN